MDQVRSILGEMKATEDGLLAARQQEWQDAVTLSSRVTWGGSILLLLLIAGAVVLMSRDFQTLQTQNWLRTGHMGLAERLQGEQRLEQLGEKVLDFLASYLGAQVGVAYFNDAGSFRRFASYATAAEGNAPAVLPGDGLLGHNRAYREWITWMYKENRLVRGRMRLDGRRVDLHNVDQNVLVVTAGADHIAPRQGTLPLLDMLGSEDVTHFDRPGGHIGLMAGSRARREIWPDLAEWLGERSDR